jgi:two-component sensor histidine kinase
MVLLDSGTSHGNVGLRPLFLVEEITHRVLNEYTEAISCLALAAAQAPDSLSEAALTSAALRLRARAEAHRALQAPLTNGVTDLGDYIARLAACLNRAQLAAAGVRLTVSADEVWLGAEQCWRVGLIIAELIRNATRHGFRGGPGNICVEIAQASGRVSCEVCDDGRGTPVMGGGRGRRVVEALAADLAGSISWFHASGGCCARLEFPAACDMGDVDLLSLVPAPRGAGRAIEGDPSACAGHDE